MTKTKIRRIVSVFVLSVLCCTLGAQTVTKTFKNESLENVLKELDRQTGYSFLFNASDLESAPTVTATFKETPLTTVLSTVIKAPYSYEMKGKVVAVTKKAGTKPAQQAKPHNKKTEIKGVVKDKDGEPLVGVAVWIRGTQISSITDLEGNFSLSFSGDYSTVSVSSIGYKDQTFEVSPGSQTVSIVLQDDDNELDEVVVVGMNNRQTKRSITGAISTIQTRELVQSPVANISNALAGKLPGLMTVQYSGEPGADAATLYIRGLGTYGTSTPLVVIDGLPRNKSDLDMIDPNEVESITILKDAASSSLYGIQGANGVVVVTTRRGSGEEQPRISVNIQQALQQPIRLPVIMSSYDQALYNRALDYNNGQPLTYSDEVIEALRTGSDPYLYPSTNWFDVVLKKHSWQQQYNVNISGSTGKKFKVNYFISGSYVRQGTLLNHEDVFEENYGVKAKYDRVNFRSNLDVQATKRLNIRIDLAARLETRVGPSQSFSYIFGQITNRLPASQAVFNPDGSIAAGSGLVNPSRPGNPYGVLTNSGYYNNGSNVLYGTVSAKYNLDFITKGLTVQGFFSFENTANLNRYWSQDFEQKWYRGLDEDGEPVYQDYTTEGRLSASTGTYVERYSYYDIRLNYDRDFGAHQVNAQLLGNRTLKNLQSSEYMYAYQGLSARATYNYAKRYFGEFNLGYNGSENFPPGRRYGLFPSFSAGWVISDEPWLNMPSAVKILKLRGSYGTVGNDQIGGSRFLYISEYGPGGGMGYMYSSGYYFGLSSSGTNSAGGYNETRVGNEYVTWEVAHKANVGFDLSLFKGNLLNLTVDYFRELRTNILTEAASVPLYVGIETIAPRNSGKVFNHGFEFEIRFNKAFSRDFSAFANLQGTYARNKVLENDQPVPKFDYQDLRGYEIGYSLGYHAIGLFQDQEDIDNSPTQNLGTELIPGDIKYQDTNKDGTIDSNDRIPIKCYSVPVFTGGLSLGFNWKNFDFSMMLSGALGSTARLWVYESSIINLKRWTETNKEAILPVAHNSSNNNMLNDFNLMKTDYLKLRNVELGYNVPSKWLRKARIDGLRIYLNAQNVAIWDTMWLKDRDPEAAGTGTLPYPLQRVINGGIRIDL